MSNAVETRPDGRLYRARKSPVVEFFEGDWPDENSAMVIRMDSKSGEEARRMVIEEGKKIGIELVNSGVFGWWRLTIRNNERCWEYDSVNGSPGWFFNVE